MSEVIKKVRLIEILKARHLEKDFEIVMDSWKES